MLYPALPRPWHELQRARLPLQTPAAVQRSPVVRLGPSPGGKPGAVLGAADSTSAWAPAFVAGVALLVGQQRHHRRRAATRRRATAGNYGLRQVDLEYVQEQLRDVIRKEPKGACPMIKVAIDYRKLRQKFDELPASARDFIQAFPKVFIIEAAPGAADVVRIAGGPLPPPAPASAQLAQTAPKVIVQALPQAAQKKSKRSEKSQKSQKRQKVPEVKRAPTLTANTRRTENVQEMRDAVKEFLVGADDRVDLSEVGALYKLRKPLDAPPLRDFLGSFPEDFIVTSGFSRDYVELASKGVTAPTLGDAAVDEGQDEGQGAESDLDGLADTAERRLRPRSRSLAPRAQEYADMLASGHAAALGPTPSERDGELLAQAFGRYVQEHGFLSAAYVRAEIHAVCKLRNIEEQDLLSDGRVGVLLAGFSKMLLLVDATLLTCFATQPMMTLHDIQEAVLEHKIFAGKRSLEEAGLGRLQFHPEVKTRLRLDEIPDGVPTQMPEVDTKQLLKELFDSQLFGGRRGGGRYKPYRVSFTDRLTVLAKRRGLDDYRKLGVYVQEEALLDQMVPAAKSRAVALKGKLSNEHRLVAQALAEWMAVTSLDAHGQFLRRLGELSSQESQTRFLEQMQAAAGTQAGLPAPAADAQNVDQYLFSIFRAMQAAAKPTVPEGQETRELAQAASSDSVPAGTVAADIEDKQTREEEEEDVLQAAAPSLKRLPSEEDSRDHELASEISEILADRLTARPQISTRDLLQALGDGEDELCQRWNVTCWQDFGLQVGFGRWVAQHSNEVLSFAGPAGILLGGSGRLEREAVALCTALREHCDAATALRAARAHFGSLLSPAELEGIVAAKPSAVDVDGGDVTHRGVLDLQVALAAAGHLPLSGSQEELPGREASLVAAATMAIQEVPLLMDLAEALPDWNENFRPFLGDLAMFLRSPEFIAAAADPSAILQVRCGVFVRLPRAADANEDAFTAAVQSGDARLAAAIILTRTLEFGGPLALLEEAAGQAYRGMPDVGQIEEFVLRAVALLPRETPGAALNVLVNGYLRLERPKELMVEVASGSPEMGVALKRLGVRCGIAMWREAPVAASEAMGARSSLTAGRAGRTPHSEAENQDAMQAVPVAEGSSKEDEPTATLQVEAVSPEGREPEPLQSTLDNRQLCRTIAALTKVDFEDVDMVTRQWKQEPRDEGVRAMQDKIQGAVHRLSEDLYSGETHFLLELVQNVDDCTYPEGVCPALKVTFETRPAFFNKLTTFDGQKEASKALLVFDHNEVGFAEANVRAICNINKSTKGVGQKRFIGAKGIGFKSVFLATNTPIVHSNIYNFHFDAQGLKGLGTLIPFPLDALKMRVNGTRIVLPLREDTGPLRKRRLTTLDVGNRALRDLRPTLLLFLRRLERMETIDTQLSKHDTMQKVVTETSAGPASKIVTLLTESQRSGTVSATSQRWFIHTVALSLPRAFDSDGGQVQTELKLAFRLDAPDELPHQEAYAWLPLRSYGLRFIVQADWRVPSSREAIIAGEPLNQFIRENVPGAFGTAALDFVTEARAAAGGERIFDSPSAAVAAAEEEREGPGGGGICEAELASHVQKAVQVLTPLYQAIPMPDDGEDFFEPTTAAILRQMQEVPCVLVRVLIRNGGPADDGDDATESQANPDSIDGSRVVGSNRKNQAMFQIALARPREVVRLELAQQVPADLRDCVSELEPLLAAVGLRVEVGGLPLRAAQALGIRGIDSSIALECLAELSRRLTSETGGEAEKAAEQGTLRLLHLLMLVVACEGKVSTKQLRSMRILPTAAGQLVALDDTKVYDIDPLLAKALNLQSVDPRLRDLARKNKVEQLLLRMGVERADGRRFFMEELLPRFTAAEPPPESQLIECTRVFRRLLGVLRESDRKSMLDELTKRGWWVCAKATGERESSAPKPVRVGGASCALHLTALPRQLALAAARCGVPLQWLVPTDEYEKQVPSDVAIEGDLEWPAFWRLLGAWPAIQVETVRSGDEDADFTSSEFGELTKVIGFAKEGATRSSLAQALVQLLAPYGPDYSQYLWRRSTDSQTKVPSSLGEALLQSNWLPSAAGGVLAGCGGWLSPQDGQRVAKAQGEEQRFTFHICVGDFARQWPDLGLEAVPSGATIVHVLRNLTAREAQEAFSIAEMTTLYIRLMEATRISSKTTGLLAALPCRAEDAVPRFLEDERWIFIPDHNQPHGSFKKAYERPMTDPRKGKFYRASELVFRDPAMLLDSYNAVVTDHVCDRVRELVGKRVVGNYYFGPETLYPATLDTRGKLDGSLHVFFRRYGVGTRIGQPEYLKVLEEVDRVVGTDRGGGHVDALGWHEAVGLIFADLAKRVRVQVEDDGSGLEDDDAGAEFEGGGRTAENPSALELFRVEARWRASEDLRQFVLAASPLRCIRTMASTWEPLGRAIFNSATGVNASTQNWDKEARRLVADNPIQGGESRVINFVRSDALRGQEMCGLKRKVEDAIVQRALVSSVADPRRAIEAKTAKEAVVAAAQGADVDAKLREHLRAAACEATFIAAEAICLETVVAVVPEVASAGKFEIFEAGRRKDKAFLKVQLDITKVTDNSGSTSPWPRLTVLARTKLPPTNEDFFLGVPDVRDLVSEPTGGFRCIFTKEALPMLRTNAHAESLSKALAIEAACRAGGLKYGQLRELVEELTRRILAEADRSERGTMVWQEDVDENAEQEEVPEEEEAADDVGDEPNWQALITKFGDELVQKAREDAVNELSAAAPAGANAVDLPQISEEQLWESARQALMPRRRKRTPLIPGLQGGGKPGPLGGSPRAAILPRSQEFASYTPYGAVTLPEEESSGGGRGSGGGSGGGGSGPGRAAGESARDAGGSGRGASAAIEAPQASQPGTAASARDGEASTAESAGQSAAGQRRRDRDDAEGGDERQRAGRAPRERGSVLGGSGGAGGADSISGEPAEILYKAERRSRSADVEAVLAELRPMWRQADRSGATAPMAEDLPVDSVSLSNLRVDTGGGGASARQLRGQLGEQVARRALEERGFVVLWENAITETGLPFDLIAAPRDCVAGCKIIGKMKAGLDQARSLVECVAEGRPWEGETNFGSLAFVEVKTSSGGKEFFDISPEQVRAMQDLGPRYWLVRVENLNDSGLPSVRLVRDLSAAERAGEVRLLMAA